MRSRIETIGLNDAAERIRRGDLVAFPTETVYGLGANALDAAAVRKIFELKGRPETSPLIVHVSDVEMARRYVTEWPARAEELARRYWPGPLTLVLPKSAQIPDIVTAGLPTVGIRVPAHEIALQLIQAAGVPIAAPSANRFTGLSPTKAEHVRQAFDGAVPVLDGGPTRVGIESTVVSLIGAKMTLLRPGMISFGEIEQAAAGEGPHPSPGMHERHYSPQTPLILVDGPRDLPDRRGAYVWWRRAGLAPRSVKMPGDPAGYAARLYGVLHELDRENWPWIAIEKPPEKLEWRGIWDRLRRAARDAVR
ncbi:MAG TPA: L-threonylcarbamoyladenylate synthase [Bryobacteraceae bacterium]|jgi:L-threonylcarbamoyladenylate synthase|nr:L-threonylcarbamoyladenylate synthase [Bryobacteraceae bacterium]